MRASSAKTKPPAKVFGPDKSQRAARRGGFRPGVFYGCFSALLTTNVLTLLGFLMAPDIAALMNGQNDAIFSAYEDRIAQLRLEVDRLYSRQYAQAGDLNLQLQELTQQQDVLIEQHQYVKQLAEKAAELGIQTASLSEEAEPVPALVSSVGGLGDPASEVRAAAEVLQDMMTDSRMALAAISTEAGAATEEILDTLEGVGIRAALPDGEAMGGPLIAPRDDVEDASLVDDANSVMEALLRLKAAKAAAGAAPIYRPITERARMSSSYGNRKDPFTGRRAFHAGLDFPSPTGTIVTSAGKGKVSFAGTKSGYGKVVEIIHENGMMTRYAHMSAVLARQGQSVGGGTPIGKVGSTGRSTGPHLHFEVRQGDQVLDPRLYLKAGKRLARFL